MLKVAVVSARAGKLASLLEGRLPEGVEVFTYEGEGEVPEQLLQAEVVLGAPDLTPDLLNAMPHLRWVQSTWAGITPFLECPRRDYRLSGVKGLFGRSMSEYVLGWLLAIKRSVLRHARAEHWDDTPDRGLADLRMGIAGIGSIGSEVATRCGPFVAEVRGLNRDGRPVAGCDQVFSAGDRLAFAQDLDVLVLLLPDTRATDAVADEQLLACLAPNAILINGGRANALDLHAALKRLESGHLGAMVLDVLEREPLPAGDVLWKTPGLYLSSHTAAPSNDDAISRLFLDNLGRYATGEMPEGLIDFERGY